MKQIILSLILLLSISSVEALAQDNSNVSQQAIEAYNKGNFKKTIELLEKERETQSSKGLESSDLYYNLGNAYFRDNQIAKARLNYERASLIDPGNRDVKHNIDYVNTKIEDKIVVADTFFLSIWFRVLQNLLSSNGWAKFAIGSFILLIVSLFAFFFGRNIIVKKSAFYTGLVMLILVIFANIFSYSQKQKIEHHDTAIIMTSPAPIYSSPDVNSKELFILHAGTKVTINKEDRTWLEIEIDNGSIGWVQRDQIEII